MARPIDKPKVPWEKLELWIGLGDNSNEGLAVGGARDEIQRLRLRVKLDS